MLKCYMGRLTAENSKLISNILISENNPAFNQALLTIR